VTQQLQGQRPEIRVDLYEAEVDIFFQDEKKVINRVQKHGEVKEERYIWGRDGFNRPRREKLILSLVLPSKKSREFKIAITQLDNSLSSKVEYRLISNLV
jgi:hypothetical protein